MNGPRYWYRLDREWGYHPRMGASGSVIWAIHVWLRSIFQPNYKPGQR